MYRGYIMVCCGPNCELSSGRLADEFEVQIKLAGLRKEIQVIQGGCLGLCGSGPNVIPGGDYLQPCQKRGYGPHRQ